MPRTSLPSDPEERRKAMEEAQQRYEEKRRDSVRSAPMIQAERGGFIMPGFKWNRNGWAEAVLRWKKEADELGLNIDQQIAEATQYLEENDKFVD